MRPGHTVRVMSIGGVVFVLGVLGAWWYLQAGKVETQLQAERQHLQLKSTLLQTTIARLSQSVAALEQQAGVPPKTATQEIPVTQLRGRIADLETTRTTLEAGMRHAESVQAQIRDGNQHLQQESALLQETVVDLKSRIAALEQTKTTLEDTLDSMQKQLDASMSKRAPKRVITEKPPVVASPVALRRPPLQHLPPTTVGSQTPNALQSLAQDNLALLLVTFLITHEQKATGWFSAPDIQARAGQQEPFVLFQYHSWGTLEAKLRRMERAGVVKGRDADDPRMGRQFAIDHGEPLSTFQTLASR